MKRLLAPLRELPVTIARIAWRSPFAVLACAAVLTVVSAIAASSLTLEADLAVLLPKHFESVQGIDELEARFGGVGYVVVVGQSDDADALMRFADDVAPRLEALEHIRYVDYKRPIDFFRERALYFLDLADLESIEEKVTARVKWEKNRQNPLYIDLDESPAPPLDFGDLEEKYMRDGKGEWLARQTSVYYLDADKGMIALLAKPTAISSNLSYSESLLGEVRESLNGLDMTKYGAPIAVALTGRYQKNFEQQTRIRADLGVAFGLAVALLLIYLLFHLRSLVSAGIIVLPLALGLIWMLGATGVLYAHLNILTGFLGAIVMGLGVDHGIHLMARYRGERQRAGSAADALDHTFEHTARAVIIAALTTAAAFAALAFSEFRAFRELGVIASIGLILVLGAYTMVLPALLALAERLGWVPPKLESRDSVMARFSAAVAGAAPAIFWVTAVVLMVLIPRAGEVRFDYDFGALEGGRLPAFVLDANVNELLGYSQTPVAILTQSSNDEAGVAAALRASKQRQDVTSSIDFVATVADLVPDNQAAKQAIMHKIAKRIRRVKLAQLDEDVRADFTDLKRMLDAEPFDRASLPIELKRQFIGVGSDDSGFVLIFPGISLADGELVSQFADEIRGVTLPDGSHVKASGEAMILADVLLMVKAEAPPILALTLVLIVAITWGLLGGFARAVVVVVPVLVLTFGLLGYLSLIEMDLNYMNIIVIPILLGVGVDGAVHLSTRTREDLSGDGAWATAVGETNRAIVAGFITTGIGFGALLVAEHPGLNSIGTLSLLGTAANFVIIVLGFTAFVALQGRYAVLTAGHGALDKATVLTATVGLAGLSPVSSGTLGAFAALPVALWLGPAPMWTRIACAGALTLVAIPISHRYAERFGGSESDPRAVVLDEFVGLLITSLFVPVSVWWLLAAFGAFRVMDIVKPWPVRLIDRRIKGGLGIVLDDVLAGLMAGALLLAVRLAT